MNRLQRSRSCVRSAFAMAFVFAVALAGRASAQDAPATLAARTAAVLQRESSGHSPTDDDINSATQQTATPDQLREALPNLLKLLALPDAPARTYALSVLIALQAPAEKSPDPNQPPPPASYSADTTRVLAPAIPEIAKHLTDEAIPNPSLTANVLGGFVRDTPPAVFPPLYAYLQRDGAIAGVGFEVVQDLLQLGPLSMNSAVAIGRYLRRRDQTPGSRANLVDAISGTTNQSQPLNKTLLEYLDSDDASLRARLILSLPQLDLAPDVFADARSRVNTLAENANESLPVTNAAKAITTCWTAPRTPNCPAYATAP